MSVLTIIERVRGCENAPSLRLIVVSTRRSIIGCSGVVAATRPTGHASDGSPDQGAGRSSLPTVRSPADRGPGKATSASAGHDMPRIGRGDAGNNFEREENGKQKPCDNGPHRNPFYGRIAVEKLIQLISPAGRYTRQPLPCRLR